MQIIINCCNSQTKSLSKEYCYFGSGNLRDDNLTPAFILTNSDEIEIGDTATIKRSVNADTMWVAVPTGHTLERFYIESYPDQDLLEAGELHTINMTLEGNNYVVYYYHLLYPLLIDNSYVVVVK